MVHALAHREVLLIGDGKDGWHISFGFLPSSHGSSKKLAVRPSPMEIVVDA
jgi:hypothetical protein